MTAAPVHQHIKAPTFSAGCGGDESLRHAVAYGRGISAICCDCHETTKRSAAELLEKLWRHADVSMAEIGSHFRCSKCSGVRLILGSYQHERFDNGHKQGAFLAMREAQVNARLMELAYEWSASAGYDPHRNRR